MLKLNICNLLFSLSGLRDDRMSTSGGGTTPTVRGKLVPQQSTVWTRRQHAVCVRRACKTYGQKENQHIILENLNMTVPKGCIYGLLGASGCGKTTLLSCIVGRRRLNSGEIWVLGGKPGNRGSGVPGPRVGYMPQEIALYGEFTIMETFKFFGWVAGLKTSDIENRSDFLIKLLQLPGPERRVKELSGGQQRRVSMAATFIHDPELLILDEPTSGVDPVLRQRIWDYLVELTTVKGTTIIITTHYIDETKQATLIGLMRGGRFLAEESPAELLLRHNSDSLEDAFLKLSILQNKGKRRRSSIVSDVVAHTASTLPELQDGIVNDAFETMSEISGEFGDNMIANNARPASPPPPPAPVDPLPPEETVECSWKDAFQIYASNHMKALIWKNILWMWRSVGMIMFIFVMPIIEIVIFCLSIGRDPVGLHLAIVNNEHSFGTPCNFNSSCVYENLGCRYLDLLGKSKHTLVNYQSLEEASYAVSKGWAWGLLEIPPYFSEMMELRTELERNANDTVLEGSEISVRLDMSNQQIAILLKRDIYLNLQEFARGLARACEVPESLVTLPIRFNTPIFGPRIPNFTNFAAPGVILTIVFFLSVALTSGTMLIERNEGILERCLVCGITGFEILSSHVITQFVIMMIQSLAVLIFALFVFNVVNQGHFIWVFILVVLCGTCGMTYGFVVSCICDDERNATYLALGSFLPFVMLCGIIWPVEGMHRILRSISYFLPLTLSTESLRSILARGWDIDQPFVYAGFISTLIWILIYMAASILLLKFKKG
ncbi:ABC transporter G family member 23-like isoform X2 [Rhodnius prolixus]|uniref:ABC transporter G family member 23-like isoform X2 n=1 Tax=Rhodnius prolixus TaxID=13249 RepID=UPI003D187B5F